MVSKVVKVSLFGDFDNNTDRYHPKKYYGLTEANATINEIDNRIEIPPCPSILMNPFCWSFSNTPDTALLSCPPAWIMRHNLTNNNLRNLAVSSKVCLANNQNLSSASWSLCGASSAFYMIDDDHKLKYPLDFAVGLFVSFIYFCVSKNLYMLRFKLLSSAAI